jgi:hypothetical protein
MKSFRRICSLILAVVFATSAAFAQSSHGAMAGSVTDPTGAVIPGARVLLTEEAPASRAVRYPRLPATTDSTNSRSAAIP